MKRIRQLNNRHNPTTSNLTRYLPLIIIPMILAIISLFFVFEASSIRALGETGDSFYYLKLQMRWIFIGSILLLIFSFFDYKKLYFLAFPLMMGVIVMLVAVLIPGIGQKVNGARRWIDLGIITIQPTEFAKFATTIYLS